MEENRKTQSAKDDFETIRLLGKGEYGKVQLVRKKSTGELFALKTLNKNSIKQKKQIQNSKSEKSILQRLNHPYIVRLRQAFHTNLKLYLVLEYCSGGELFSEISKVKKFSEEKAKFYSACIVLALNYLHNLNIVYRE